MEPIDHSRNRKKIGTTFWPVPWVYLTEATKVKSSHIIDAADKGTERGISWYLGVTCHVEIANGGATENRIHIPRDGGQGVSRN